MSARLMPAKAMLWRILTSSLLLVKLSASHANRNLVVPSMSRLMQLNMKT